MYSVEIKVRKDGQVVVRKGVDIDEETCGVLPDGTFDHDEAKRLLEGEAAQALARAMENLRYL